MAAIKREYLDLPLGNIGDRLPKEFRFDSKQTYDEIIKKIESDILKPMQKKTDEKNKEQSAKLNESINKWKEGNKIGDNFDNSLYAVCKNIPFDDNYLNKISATSDKPEEQIPYQIFNLIPNYVSNNDKNINKRAQYVIGRISSIKDFGGYNMRAFRSLYLQGKSFDWTPSVNDLFITCSLAYAKKILNSNQNMLLNNKNLLFPIMLIMDKRCLTPDPDDKDIPAAFKKIKMDAATYTETFKDVKDAEAKCIFPSVQNIPQLPFPSITFRELVILTDIIGMNVYKLKTPTGLDLVTDEHYVYYFSFKDDKQLAKQIEDFNNANSSQGYKIIPVQVNWARKDSQYRQKGGKYYEKYMNYKTKYMLLKKISSVNKS